MMFKYKTFSTILFILFSFFVQAQDYDLIWSDLNKKDSKKDRLGFVDFLMSEDGKHYFVVFEGSRKKSAYSLLTLNDEMNIVSKIEIDFKVFGKEEVAFNEAVALNGKMYLRTSYFNNSKDMKYGFISELSKEGILSKDLIELDAMEVEKKRDYSFFSFDISEDESKIMISRMTPYKKNEQENYALKVLDSEFNEIWSNEIVLPYKDKIFTIYNYNVDNNGNAFLSGRLYEGKNETKERDDDYKYKIYMHNPSTSEIEEYTLDLGSNYPTEMDVNFNAENLICTGFYSDGETDYDAGIFYLEVDKKTGENVNKSMEGFDQKMKDEYRTEKQIKKDKQEDKGVPNFEVRDIYLTPIGEKIMIAEQYRYYITTRMVTSYGANGAMSTRMVTTHHYVYGDLLLTKFSASGEILWMSKIDKYQHTTNDGGYLSSYISKLYGNGEKVELIFAEMESRKEAESKKKEDRYLTKAYTVSGDGTVSEEKKLFTLGEEETIFRAKASVELDEFRTLILGERKLDYKFGLLQFK